MKPRKLKPKPKVCQNCDSEVATSVEKIFGNVVRLCDRCSEKLGMETQHQHEKMRSAGHG